MKEVGIGLIGTGFMGKCHALAYGAVKAVFGDVPAPRLEFLFDPDPDVARRRAGEFGFARWTTDWRALVADPAVEVVSITAPNRLHRKMTEAAAQAGKVVYCEKPLALTLADGIAIIAPMKGEDGDEVTFSARFACPLLRAAPWARSAWSAAIRRG